MDADRQPADRARMDPAWVADMKWLREMSVRVEAEFRAEVRKQRRLERQNQVAAAFGLPPGLMWLGLLLMVPLVVAIGFVLAQ